VAVETPASALMAETNDEPQVEPMADQRSDWPPRMGDDERPGP
jgi:hypothetical protein